MFRAKKDDRSDGELSSTDDDEPIMKTPRFNNDDTNANKKRRKNPWIEVIQERELDRIAGVQVEEVIIERGSETFGIPSDKKTSNEPSNFKELGEAALLDTKKLPLPVIAVSPADEDDPFAGTPNDLAQVEKFGFDSQPSTSNGIRRGTISKRGRGSRGMREGVEKRVDSQNEWPPLSGKKNSTRGKGMTGATRGTGPRGMTVRGNSGPRGMVIGSGNKRKYGEMKGLKSIINREYSIDGLLATEFEDDLTVAELGIAIAKALGEKETDLIGSIVNVLGKDLALRIFDKTREVEAVGGMMVLDGSRRRSPGGVFLAICKEDTSITPKTKDEIAILSMQKTRLIKKAKRKKSKTAPLKNAETKTTGEKIDSELSSNIESSQKVPIFLADSLSQADVELDYDGTDEMID